MKKTACPLDCYDSCEIEIIEGKIRGSSTHPMTKGYLCRFMNSYEKFERIKKPRYLNKEIELDEALEILSSKLEEFKDKKSLLFRGSGNLGKMQEVTNLFFKKYKADFTKGTLCEGAGEFGIVESRGANFNMPIEEIKKSEVVIVWGRNITDTNAHLYHIIKDKKIIVIDPISTKIAKEADLFLQIVPRSDIYLAILLCRFALMNGMEDIEFIKNKTQEYDYFLDFINSFRINHIANEYDIDLLEVDKILEMIEGKRVAFLIGIGVQKYEIGHFVLRAIESFVAMVGLFNKEGSGVHYIADSSFGFKKPFEVKGVESKPLCDFAKYDLVFIQGANPITQMPCTDRVKKSLSQSKFIIYYGIYENETSQMADLIIPSSHFLEKEDLRVGYGHEYFSFMSKIREKSYGISEYDLTKYLIDNIKEEQEYIKEIVESKNYPPYRVQADSFDKFIFIDEFEDDKLEGEGYFLLTCKSKKSLNSQFERDEYLYIHSNSDFYEDEEVLAKSKYGKAKFKIRYDDRLRKDSILIYSGNSRVNYLTPNRESLEGNSAIYQEVKIILEKR